MAARIVVLGIIAAAVVLAFGFWVEQGWVMAVGMVAMGFTVVAALAWPNHNPALPRPPSPPPRELIHWDAAQLPTGVSLAILVASLVLGAGFWAQQGWIIGVGMGAVALVMVMGLVTSASRSG
jgi:hypothetical protein